MGRCMETLVTHHGFSGIATPDDKRRSDYIYIPFNVPEETNKIIINYSYPKSDDNIIDIGIFDPHGHGFLNPKGFRGWSGSERTSFYIAENAATPGYIAGKIAPGLWAIILGLYKIREPGCSYSVEVDLYSERTLSAYSPSPVMRGERTSQPKWYAGDLQSHTEHSDGKNTLGEMVAHAKNLGLEYLAITDHNTISQNLEIKKLSNIKITVIPGIEVTTYYGHANVWNNKEWIDFRCRTDEQMQKIIDQVHKQGLLFSVNHPKENGPKWEYKSVRGIDCVEVWSGPWSNLNHQAMAFWESLLSQGERIPAVGGSDAHWVAEENSPVGLGRPTTWLYAESNSVEDLLRAIKEGHSFISNSPRGPMMDIQADINGDGNFEMMMGEQASVSKNRKQLVRVTVANARKAIMRFLINGKVESAQKINKDKDFFDFILMVREPVYCRAEVIKEGDSKDLDYQELEMLALSNPICFKPSKTSSLESALISMTEAP